MFLFACCFFLAQATAETKPAEIICEQYRVIGEFVYCINSSADEDNQIVTCYLVKRGEFEKRFEFDSLHPRLEDILAIEGKIFCAYRDGTIEQRDLKKPHKIESKFALGSEISDITLFPEFSKEKGISALLVHGYSRRKRAIYQRVAKIAISQAKMNLEWDALFDSKQPIKILDDGFYVARENEVTKYDLISGKPISQINSTALGDLHFVEGETTLLINKNNVFEFWDLENFEMKRTLVVPDSYGVFGDIIVVSKGNQYSFRDLNGDPIEKYPPFNFEDGRIWWIANEKLCFRKVDGTVQLFELPSMKLTFEGRDVVSFFEMSHGQHLTSKASGESEKHILTLTSNKTKQKGQEPVGSKKSAD